MPNEIKIIKKKVGENFEFETIEHSLEKMWEIVGGYLECVRLPNNVDMWINDSGLIDGLPINLIIMRDNEPIHHICGDVFFATTDHEGETISITKEQMAYVINRSSIIGEASNEDKTQHFVFAINV